jgi:hypothetical protein
MPGMSNTIHSHKRDEEMAKYRNRKRDDDKRERYLPCQPRRPMQLILTAILLFFFYVYYYRQSYQSQIIQLSEQLDLIHQAGTKFAIVTYETRDVTYWRESLDNKISYSRKHG